MFIAKMHLGTCSFIDTGFHLQLFPQRTRYVVRYLVYLVYWWFSWESSMSIQAKEHCDCESRNTVYGKNERDFYFWNQGHLK